MKRRPGSFGARPCRAMRVRLMQDGESALPKSWRKKWIIQRIIATPAWADFKAIQAVYDKAAELTAKTGVLHVVDHDYPLNHPRVCGLHVHQNLRPIPYAANANKSNYFCPEQMELFDKPEQLRLI